MPLNTQPYHSKAVTALQIRLLLAFSQNKTYFYLSVKNKTCKLCASLPAVCRLLFDCCGLFIGIAGKNIFPSTVSIVRFLKTDEMMVQLSAFYSLLSGSAAGGVSASFLLLTFFSFLAFGFAAVFSPLPPPSTKPEPTNTMASAARPTRTYQIIA